MRFMDKLQQKLFIHAEKEFMGLMAFAGNQPTLKETVIAKNYLNEKELRAMGCLLYTSHAPGVDSGSCD